MNRHMMRGGLLALTTVAAIIFNPGLSRAAAPAAVPPPAVHDGGHDFDFVIGDWKAHVRRLPDRLVGSTKWIEYDGISNHHKLLDSNANFEEFEVRNAAGDHLKGQTLRLYNPESHQWSIYLVDVNKGTLDGPPQIGQFTTRPDGKTMGEFYAQDLWKGRAVMIRYQWTSLSPTSAHMEQAFSDDGGKNWDVNWICELSK